MKIDKTKVIMTYCLLPLWIVTFLVFKILRIIQETYYEFKILFKEILIKTSRED